MKRLAVGLLVFIAAAAPAQEAPARPEIPAAVITAGGSRLLGLVSVERPLILRTEQAPRKLDFAAIKSIAVGERYDPNLENEARVAVGDLQSDQHAVREKAFEQLRKLGRAAIGALRGGAKSPDPEVANRARLLLGELGVLGTTGTSGDRIVMSDGVTLHGSLAPTEVLIRSRWGCLRFPLECLDSITAVRAEELNPAVLAAGAPVAVQPKATASAGVARDLASTLDSAFLVFGASPRMTALAFDQIPNPDRAAAAAKRMVETKPGDKLDDAYAPWGVLLRPVTPGAAVTVAEAVVQGRSGGLSASAKSSDLNVHFVLPGTLDAQTGAAQTGGVTMIGAVFPRELAGGVGMAAYDRAGRELAVLTDDTLPEAGARPVPAVIRAMRSRTPIARVRFFRIGPGKEQDLVLDDLTFDRIVSVDRPPENACVWLGNGERLAGGLAAAQREGGVALRPEFLDEKAAAIEAALETIERFEPARTVEQSAKDDPKQSKEARAARRLPAGAPHGVLLQSGESFRARLLALNAQEALLVLAGGVEMKLPRPLLRKVDLAPPQPEPGEMPAPTTVAEDEKPGVDFKRREQPTKVDGKKDEPKKEEPKADEKARKKDPLQTTQELQRMDNAEVVAMDALAGELTIKDEYGEMTIGLPPVKTLVFAKDPNAPRAGPKFRDWALTLRDGSQFEIELKTIAPDGITAEMAGGVLRLPLDVVESAARRKR
jgi:hypothetical protein